MVKLLDTYSLGSVLAANSGVVWLEAQGGRAGRGPPRWRGAAAVAVRSERINDAARCVPRRPASRVTRAQSGQ